jgi:tripeptide aminopeptidase
MNRVTEFIEENGEIIREVLDVAGGMGDALVTRLREIAEIPSPTFHEDKRTEYLMRVLPQAGLRDVTRLAKGSVLGFTKSKHAENTLLLTAHIDTVFPTGTDLATRIEDSRLYGPGTGDNAANLAAVISLAEIIRDMSLRPARNISFCGNVCEEGTGNLAGMAEIMEYMGKSLGTVIAVDGRMPHILHRSLAIRRYRITASGPGGHSWMDFRTPSAVHELARVVAAISCLEVPTEPKTTFNVGTLRGGKAVNTIAQECTADVEFRSLEADRLASLEREFLKIVEEIPAPGVRLRTEVTGERPAGVQPPESDLVRTAVDAGVHLGLEPELGAASTDAALPASCGIPAMAMGTYRGEGVHTLEEYVEIDSLATGLGWLAVTVLALAGLE